MFENLLRHATILAIGMIGVILAWILIRSVDWNIASDAATLQYFGWRVSTGEIPYKDFFPIDVPGSILLHSVIFRIAGFGSLGVQMADLALLGLVALSVRSLVKNWLPWSFAMCLIGSWHLMLGRVTLFQRDWIMSALIVIVYALIVKSMNRKRSDFLFFIAGLLAGYAFTVKPNTVLLIAGIPLFLQVRMKRFMPSTLFLAGTALPAFLVVGWLWRKGGLTPFLSWWPAMARIHQAYNGMQDDALIFVSQTWWIIPMMFGIYGLFLLAFTEMVRQHGDKWMAPALAAHGAIGGLISIAIQGKGLSYHSYPFVLCAVLLATFLTEHLSSKKKQYLTMFSLLTFGVFQFTVPAVKHINTVPDEVRVFYRVQRSLPDVWKKAGVQSGDTVQCLTDDVGCLQDLYWLGEAGIETRLSSPLVYTWMVTGKEPVLEETQRKLLHDLKNSPPKYFMVYGNGRLERKHHFRFETFPELRELIEEEYVTVAKRDGEVHPYQLYIRQISVSQR